MRFNLKKTLAFVAAGLMLPLFALAQSVRISGTVTDQSGAPVPGAAVMVVDSSNGAVTGVDGRGLLHGLHHHPRSRPGSQPD